MRISDWSSDVCSSDLNRRQHESLEEILRRLGEYAAVYCCNARACRGIHLSRQTHQDCHSVFGWRGNRPVHTDHLEAGVRRIGTAHNHHQQAGRKHRYRSKKRRSEEHTSELQSLMRISYAVFCLKKKKQKKKTK